MLIVRMKELTVYPRLSSHSSIPPFSGFFAVTIDVLSLLFTLSLPESSPSLLPHVVFLSSCDALLHLVGLIRSRLSSSAIAF